MGSIISIAGAFVLTFYKGPSIIKAHTNLSLPLQQPISILNAVDTSWTIAGILLTADYLLASLWYILQVGLESFKVRGILLTIKCIIDINWWKYQQFRIYRIQGYKHKIMDMWEFASLIFTITTTSCTLFSKYAPQFRGSKSFTVIYLLLLYIESFRELVKNYNSNIHFIGGCLEGLPWWTKYALLLQCDFNHHSYNCRFIYRAKCKCMENKTRYFIDLHCLLCKIPPENCCCTLN